MMTRGWTRYGSTKCASARRWRGRIALAGLLLFAPTVAAQPADDAPLVPDSFTLHEAVSRALDRRDGHDESRAVVLDRRRRHLHDHRRPTEATLSQRGDGVRQCGTRREPETQPAGGVADLINF